MEVKTCVICGKEFVPNHGKIAVCSNECYRIRKNRTNRRSRLKQKENHARVKSHKPKQGTTRDIKLYEILEIMDMYDLPIQEYLDKREFYKELYLMRKGCAK